MKILKDPMFGVKMTPQHKSLGNLMKEEIHILEKIKSLLTKQEQALIESRFALDLSPYNTQLETLTRSHKETAQRIQKTLHTHHESDPETELLHRSYKKRYKVLTEEIAQANTHNKALIEESLNIIEKTLEHYTQAPQEAQKTPSARIIDQTV